MEHHETYSVHPSMQLSAQWATYPTLARDIDSRQTLSPQSGSGTESGPGPQWHSLHNYHHTERRPQHPMVTSGPHSPSFNAPPRSPSSPATTSSPRPSPASSLAGWNNYLMADELVNHRPPASLADLVTFQDSHNAYNPIETDPVRNYRDPPDYGTRSLSVQPSTSQSHWQGPAPLAPMAPHLISQCDHAEHRNSPMAQPSAPQDAMLTGGIPSFRRSAVEDQDSRSSSVSSSSLSPTFRAIQVTNPAQNEPRDDWRLTLPIFNWLSAVLDPKRRPDKSTPAPSGNCLLCDTFCQRPGTLQQHVICQHRMRIARQYIQKRPYNDLLALTFTVLQLHSDRRPGPVENECVHFRYVLKFSPPSGLPPFPPDAFPLLRETLHTLCHTDRWKGVTCEYCGLLAQRRAALEEHVTKCSYNPTASKKKTSKKAGLEQLKRPRLVDEDN